MLRTFSSLSYFILVALVLTPAFAGKVEPKLKDSIDHLFGHSAHMKAFKSMSITCTDCHDFSVKPLSPDPLGPEIPMGHLRVEKSVCHACHLAKIPVARPNQCQLCHLNSWELRPLDHGMNWRFQHGSKAQMDPDSCKKCHTEKTCSDCHTTRNSLKPSVHRPNFRLYHSIEARANPQSCVACHSTANTCLTCHTKGF